MISIQSSSDETGDKRMDQHLQEIVDDTKSVLFKYADKNLFKQNGFECDSLLMDTCEHTLYKADDAIAECATGNRNDSHIANANDTTVAGNDCVSRFLPRVDRIIESLTVTFVGCMKRNDIPFSDEGNKAFMAKLKESLINIIRDRHIV